MTRLVRGGLGLIAFFSGVFLALSPLVSATQRARAYQSIAAVERLGSLRDAARARDEASRDDRELADNARTALVALAVSLAGLAASSRPDAR